MTPQDLNDLTRSEASLQRLIATSMAAGGDSSAAWSDEEFATMVSLGPGRYVNRAFAVVPSVSNEQITDVIDFFESRSLPPSIQLSVSSEGSTFECLADRGFTLDWTRVLHANKGDSNLVRAPRVDESPSFTVHEVGDEEEHAWLELLAEGNEIVEARMREISNEFARAARRVAQTTDLLMTDAGKPIACGSIQAVDGIAWLGGAATVPGSRGRGAQTHLLSIRVELARAQGCTKVAATAMPDGVSARNLERAGLRLADTQQVWTRVVSRRA